MPAKTLTFPPFTFEPANTCLWRGTKRIPLSPTDCAVLHYLITHAGEVVTHAELLQAVWPSTVVSPGILKVRLRRLRRALGDSATKPRFIETVQRRGYRFIAKSEKQKAKRKKQKPVLSPSASLRVNSVEGAKTRSFESESLQFAPSPSHSIIPSSSLVGREAELAQLHQGAEKAARGERQMVFVTGEPGIGKTTVVETFLAQVEQVQGSRFKVRGSQSAIHNPRSAIVARGQCVEQYGAGEPYRPVLEALGRLSRGPNGKRLKAVLRHCAPTWLAQLPTLLSAAEREKLQREVLGATRERMLRELAEAVEALTDGAQAPAPPLLVLVLEDLHWSDASTIELLAVLARRPEPARLLMIGTYRPVEVLGKDHPLTSLVPELLAHGQCSEVALGGLSQQGVAAYLDTRFPASALPTRLARVLHQRTGGNPLFLVNTVNDWVQRGRLVEAGGAWTLHGDLDALATEIPDTIRQLVTRQRQRLQPAEQQVLEVASVAGLEFSTASVAAALATATPRVEAQCAGLAERQQFLRPAGIAEWPDGTVAARYEFIHALYQQLWHERVSVPQRQRWHLRIGERQEVAYGERAREIAAELAVHFEQGRDYPRAVLYLQQAGENAIGRSAHVEAIHHLTKGLTLLKTLSNTPERSRQELALQVALNVPLVITKGFAVPDVEEAYARARALCQAVGETPQLVPVLHGLWRFYVLRADFQTAYAHGEQLLRIAQRTQDPGLLLTAHMTLGATLLFRGEFASARTHIEQGAAFYNPRQHRSLLFLYGEDPEVLRLAHRSWTLWYLGYPDQALKSIHESLTLTRELAHPFILAHALSCTAQLHLYRREGQAAQERAEALIGLAHEQGFPHFLAYGSILRGGALAAQGRGEEGVVQIRQGLAGRQAIGQKLGRSYFRTLLAEAYGVAGRVQEGLHVLAEALEAAYETGERLHEAEIYRLKGELTLQQFQVPRSTFHVANPQSAFPNPQLAAEAEACFHKAVEIACRQEAKSLELRAVMSLSRLWQQQGKQEQARKLLAEIYGWFTEGFDTADLQEAKALLQELT